MSRYIYLVAVALVSIGIYTASLSAGERLTARVSRAKQLAVVTVNLDPVDGDRHLYVSATSENVYESTYRQLEGASARRQYRFEWRLPDDGIYEIEARVGDSLGRTVATARTALITIPRQ